MKLKWLCILLLVVFLLVNLSYMTLVILEMANVLDVPTAAVVAYIAAVIVAGIAVRILAKRPWFRETADSSKWIQGLAYTNLICAILMIVVGGVLKCI